MRHKLITIRPTNGADLEPGSTEPCTTSSTISSSGRSRGENLEYISGMIFDVVTDIREEG